MSYKDLLLDGRWQIRKTQIMTRDKFSCRICGRKAENGVTLNVHHIKYRKGASPWEYDDSELITLCEDCHYQKHENLKAEAYHLKIGDFVKFDHSDYTDYGIVYNVDFDAMVAFIACVDDGSDLGILWLCIVSIESDGRLFTSRNEVFRNNSLTLSKTVDLDKLHKIEGEEFYYWHLLFALISAPLNYMCGNESLIYFDYNMDGYRQVQTLSDNMGVMRDNNKDFDKGIQMCEEYVRSQQMSDSEEIPF